MELSHENGTHSIRFGDGGEVAVTDVVPWGKENGEPAKLGGIFHPAGDTLTIARSTKSQFSAFGMDFSHQGKSGFSSHFSWAT